MFRLVLIFERRFYKRECTFWRFVLLEKHWLQRWLDEVCRHLTSSCTGLTTLVLDLIASERVKAD